MPIRMGGMISGLDTDAIIKDLMSAQSLKRTNVENKKQKLDWKKEKWEELNTKLYALYTEKLSNLKLQGSYLTKKVASSNSDKVTATATNAVNGTYSLQVKSLASAQFVTGADISSKGLTSSSTLVEAGMKEGQDITLKLGEAGSENYKELTINVTNDLKISDFTSKLSEAGINASFDKTSGRFYMSAKESGAAGRFSLVSSESGAEGLAALGLGDIDDTLASNGLTAADSTTMAVVAAKDAQVVLNGATLSSSKNTITANGLSLELKGMTVEGETISLNVSNDVDAVYNKIKEFVTSYNDLMGEMYDKYNAASARGYAMLTDEEKEAMSEKQVELWEDKIKDSLLRKDTTLNTIMTSFRSAMQATATIDGKSYTLASFGIVTGVYTEHGKIHINGDEDDAEYAGKTNSLKDELAKDPEKVSKALSSIFSDFYDSLSKQMSASSISSALTFYNDKQIKSQADDYESQIKNWDRRLQTIEDKYYKQFSGMEKALAGLQSQQSQLSGLLGMA